MSEDYREVVMDFDWLAEYQRRIKKIDEESALPKAKKKADIEDLPRNYLVVKWINSEIPKVVGVNLTYPEANTLIKTQHNKIIDYYEHTITVQYCIHHNSQELSRFNPPKLI
jgi:hypothetical protein